MSTTTIYLIRHAETTWNAERRLQGKLDAPLSERGIRQVQALATALRAVPLRALYSSPLARAQETARPLAEAHRLTVRPVPGLTEIDQGEWESLLLDDVRDQDGERLEAWWNAPESVRMPGGESLADVAARAVPAFLDLAGAHPGETIAVVAHGGVNKTILLAMLGAPLASYWRIRQSNACINIVEVDGASTRLVVMNETSHLADDTPHPFA